MLSVGFYLLEILLTCREVFAEDRYCELDESSSSSSRLLSIYFSQFEPAKLNFCGAILIHYNCRELRSILDHQNENRGRREDLSMSVYSNIALDNCC